MSRGAPVSEATNPYSASNMTGAALALSFGFLQVCNDAMMKILVAELGFYQVLAVRGLMVLPVIFLILWWRRELFLPLSPSDRTILRWRVLCEVAIAFFMLQALASLPLAYVIITLQTIPLGLTLAAALVFREAVGWRRWLAIIAGFFGVLLIVKPGTEGFMPEMFFAIIAAVIFIIRDMITRQLSANVPAFYTAYLQVLGVTAFNFVMIFFDEWVPLEVGHYGMFALAGALFVAMTMAAILMMRFGDISFVAQFRYSGILWAILVGVVLFGEIPDGYALIGAGIIMMAGLYALYRERQLKAQKALLSSD